GCRIDPRAGFPALQLSARRAYCLAQHLNTTVVSFTPGARTGWHSHPVGQTLYCLSGIGRICIGKGSRPQAIYPGDTVMIPPDTMHWHGAAPDRLFSHLAMSENGEQGQGTTWAEHVSDSDYKMEPATA